MRKTKIIATLGPATSSSSIVDALVSAGVDVFRLNSSHGTQDERARLTDLVRGASRRSGRAVAVLLDLQGPKIRTGALRDGKPVDLLPGSPFTITTDAIVGDSQRVSTNYPALPRDVVSGSRVLLSDGAIELEVERIVGTDVCCRVVDGGRLAERQGINLPGVSVSAPALTEKDLSDLEHGLGLGVDYIALSFVRHPNDVVEARRRIRALGRRTPVIVKIEKPEAVENVERIVALADGVMVARGDLGVELPLEDVPAIQKLITRLGRRHRIPVIVATQMLESMIANDRPTRAEVSDVANAIFDSADAVMLSGETAVGRHPVATVEIMARIAVKAEGTAGVSRENVPGREGRSASLAHAAVVLAEDIGARAIVALTRSGFTARLVSSLRPATPVIAVTGSEEVQRALAVYWGVTAIVDRFNRTTEATLRQVETRLLDDRLVEPGDTVVVLGGGPSSPRGRTSYLQLLDIRKRESLIPKR